MTGAANDVVPGPALTSPTPYPLALGHDRAGNLYMALHDYASDQSLSIYKITRAGVLSIVTNSTQAEAAPVPGPAPASPFDSVTGLAVAPDGTLYIADDDSSVVAKVTPSGTLSIVAGNGTTGTRGTVVPGPATSTQLKVSTVTVTRAWNLYFGEYDAYRLYRLDATRGPSEAPLELTAAAGIARATLSFLPPDDDGNTSVSGYQVSVDGGAWVTLTTTAGSGGRLSGVVTGLTNGQSYSFRVRAVTSISGAAASNAAQATPAAPSSGGGSWFRDVVPPAQRAQEVAVPKSPRAYRGPRVFTKARNKAYAGQTAMPVPSIKGRALAAGQAAVLSGDGLFEFTSSVLTREGRRQVRLLVPALGDAGRVVCEGYTDYGADLTWEYQLSRARAKRACSALTAGGVDAVMVPKGFGPQRPVDRGRSGPRTGGSWCSSGPDPISQPHDRVVSTSTTRRVCRVRTHHSIMGFGVIGGSVVAEGHRDGGHGAGLGAGLGARGDRVVDRTQVPGPQGRATA